jgi:Leucine-rich repeat (LRR) protein
MIGNLIALISRKNYIKSLKIKVPVFKYRLINYSVALFSFLDYSIVYTIYHKKWLLIMQVDTQPYTILPPNFVSQEDPHSTSLFPFLLPLHDYHDRLSITTLPWSLTAFATHTASLPAELIDMIQAFCSHKDLLALTSVDKTALATRFCNPYLQKLCFKTVENTKQFLAYCQASQEKEAQALILKEGQESHKRLEPALSPDSIMHFISFTQEHLQKVKALTLTLSAQFTAEQYDLLFTYLPAIQHLTINSTEGNYDALITLLKAAQRLNNLRYLTVFRHHLHSGFSYLPDELWQFTGLKTLTMSGFRNIYSISENIGQLKALKSLALDMRDLETLPASLWQLKKLEALTLDVPRISILPEKMGQLSALKSLALCSMPLRTLPTSLGRLNKLKKLTLMELRLLTTFPEEMGQLNALKSLTLHYMPSLKALPAGLWQLDKLKVLTLEKLSNITTFPEEIGQLSALKSLALQNMDKLKALPANLGQLDKLETLTLRNLPLITTLPKEMGQLRALKSLTVEEMVKLEALPTSLEQLNKLEALILEKLPSITALPEEMGRLIVLKSLELNDLRKLKALPASLGHLEKLEAITLMNLSITVLPEEMGQLNALKSLTLHYMPSLKALPASLGQLDKLEALNLGFLPSLATFPEEWANSTH